LNIRQLGFFFSVTLA